MSTSTARLVAAIDGVLETCLQQLLIDRIQQIPFSIPRLRSDAFELQRIRDEIVAGNVSEGRLAELKAKYEALADNMNYPYQ